MPAVHLGSILLTRKTHSKVFLFLFLEEQARMCSSLYTEEHLFIIQEIPSFIIEHLLCASYGAKTEARNRRSQLHSVVGKSLANRYP